MINLENSKYRWLADWGIRTLKQGEAHLARKHVDFTCEPRSFAGIVYLVARQRDLKATVAVFDHSGEVVFCFYKPDGLTRPNMPAYPIVRKMRGEAQ